MASCQCGLSIGRNKSYAPRLLCEWKSFGRIMVLKRLRGRAKKIGGSDIHFPSLPVRALLNFEDEIL